MADNAPSPFPASVIPDLSTPNPKLKPDNTADSAPPAPPVPAPAPAPAPGQSLSFAPQGPSSLADQIPTLNINMANESSTPNAGAGGSHTPAADSTISASNSNTVRPGGAPARVYMNEKIVPYLLEGMKNVAKEQPSNPLRVLGEFLIQKSNEVEGGQSGKAPE